jgi:hypothetical protein
MKEGAVYKSVEAKQQEAEVYLHHLDRNPDLVRHLCGRDWIYDSLQALPPAPEPVP